ncbi:VQ motif-containing protein 9-like [Vicia villosa]|uniref:VQ motif-containing protein 9-like n=1 Tax=Vicia villosa TaxID=3911 RepID=UPI00273BF1B6|nr:VQ motif-containing protein 9-like [Vicia villosa]
MDNKTSADSSSSDRDNYLRHLNKLSHKISKPILNNNNNNKKTSSFEQQQPQINNPLHQNPQHQPPVYNINKNDFRDVVQKLTGSPAHDRISTPPPIQQPKQQSSRLQRIRPPPLPHITNRPPPLLNNRPHLPPPQNFNFNGVNFNQSFPGFGRPQAPLSPLPPFPTVHAAAESPISAYMRDLQNFVSTMDNKSFSGFSPLPPPLPVSSHQPQPEQQQPPQQEEQEQQQENQPPPQQVVAPTTQPPVPQPFQMPSSPVPFGCLNSQLASYPLLSPGLLFSPNSANLGFPQLPLSPTVPAPSPRWREI